MKNAPIIRILVSLFLMIAVAGAAYPEKPITFIVHSKPGSAIDITTRQLTRIAAKYSDATFLVENKTGGSGIVAMRYVLDHPADGYLIQAVTKSFISTVLISQSNIRMDDFDFLACLVIDPEALITNRHSQVRTLEEIIADAKKKNGRQKWLGPLVGGVDHLMAVKTWETLGIRGEWIPFEGGSDALAALMGQHGTVYVGNPVDVIGRPDLMLAVVAARNRLPEYPDVPTFREKGYDLEEVLWRGYALKKGAPQEVVSYLTDLFRKIQADPEWVRYIKNTAAQPVFLDHEAFTRMVQKDQLEAIKYLRIAGILSDKVTIKSQDLVQIGLGLLGVFFLLLILLVAFKREWLNGEVVISLVLIFGSLFLYFVTLNFPEGKLSKTAGPAAMPRLWILGLVVFSGWLIIRSVRNGQQTEKVEPSAHLLKSVLLMVLMAVYLITMPWLGYYLATFLFLAAGMYLLSYRKHVLIWLTSAGFVAFSYLVFWKVLQVPLPVGAWGW
ncbi:MAG TPA: hypothetical protein ENJ89_09135 [Caldithrix abyssi]|uniref:DUF1468 domain-containing protein n=1 Tax=Caldithrix abyssi TaxID=187145 RepID=A0A7V5PQG6_CALAY|nr:hypothetical protein [Caldithrix abyssi]